MRIKQLAAALIRIGMSVLFAGIFYAAWLALFLAAFRTTSVPVKGVLWVIAPVVTAAGFALGLLLAERVTGACRTSFLWTFIWPLVACILGAVVVVWFGPMLIVFGMFLVGTGSVAVREVVMQIRAGNG